jgi:alpha,alpha-trehalase
VEKIVALHTSRDWAISEAGLEAQTDARSCRPLRRAARRARDRLAASVGDCDIELEEDGAAEDTELKLRVHIFHLLQTVSEHTIDLDVGVPARGWHGEAYRGHIFWDELFIFPFLSLRIPMLTRALLRYRYRRLPEARRRRARPASGRHVPWQSGSDGREETQRLHLNPRIGPLAARQHPPAAPHQSAIAYNVWQYHQATDDHEFL